MRARPTPPPGRAPVERWGGALAHAISDAHGRFVVDGLGVDEVDLDVWAWPDFTTPSWVRVRTGTGTDDVVLRVRQTRAARVRLLFPDGTPARQGKLQVTAVAGEQWRTMQGAVWRFRVYRPDESGGIRIAGLDPDARYDLYVQPPAGRPGLQGTWLRGWRPEDTDIRLERAGVVAGTVRDPDGKPVHSATVWLRDAEGATHSDGAGWDGDFAFVGLSPGRVVLGACFGPRPASWDGFFTAEAEVGDEDLVVPVHSRRDLRVVFAQGSPRPSTPGRVRLTHRGPAGDATLHGVDWMSDVACLFRGLEPGARYVVWAGPTETGRYAYVEVGPTTTEVELTLVPGGVIAGSVALPAERYDASARIAERGVLLHTRVRDDGSFDLLGVPPGTWTVEVTCDLPSGRSRSARARAAPGDTLHLELDE